MNALRVAAVALLALLPVVAAGAAPGAWSRLPSSPVKPDEGLASVWTGKRVILFGRATARTAGGAVLKRTNVAAAYDPASRRWARLTPPASPGAIYDNAAVWTGKEMLVWGQGTRLAYSPRSGHWRNLPGSPLLSVHDGHGLVVWTGREMIGWGGGCCGDAFSDGVAYNPATNRWHATAPAPLAGSQHPIGAWTGHELVVLVSGLDPDGRPWPARFARAAAYDPATNSWHRVAPLPVDAAGASAVWDGRELLVLRSGAPGFAFSPAANRWRTLAAMPSTRLGSIAVWDGKRALVWGGHTARSETAFPRTGLAYDPAANRWTVLPAAPVAGRSLATAAWTGRSLVVYGGQRPKTPLGTGTAFLRNGAVYTS